MPKMTKVRTYQMVDIAGFTAFIAAIIVEKPKESVLISPDIFRHLVQDAKILLDNGVSWPHSVQVVVTEAGQRVVDAGSRHSTSEEQHGRGHRKAEQGLRVQSHARPRPDLITGRGSVRSHQHRPATCCGTGRGWARPISGLSRAWFSAVPHRDQDKNQGWPARRREADAEVV